MAKTIPQLTDATTVNAADELIIQQGGITKRATASELLNASAIVTATGSTTARTLAARAADVVNVRDFGASGSAGASVNTPAIQAAIDYASGSSQRSTVYFPPGFYQTNATIYVRSPIHLLGSGSNRTFIQSTHSGDAIVFEPSDAGTANTYLTGPRMSHIGITRATSDNTGSAIWIRQCSDLAVDNVTVQNHQYGFRISGGQLNMLSNIYAYCFSPFTTTSTGALLLLERADIGGGNFQPCYTVNVTNFVGSANLLLPSIIRIHSADGFNLSNGYFAFASSSLMRFARQSSGDQVTAVQVSNCYFDCTDNDRTDGTVVVPRAVQVSNGSSVNASGDEGCRNARFTNCHFANNDGLNNYLIQVQKFSELQFLNCSFRNASDMGIAVNDTTTSGAASGRYVISGCTFRGLSEVNSAGQAIYIKDAANVNISNNLFVDSLTSTNEILLTGNLNSGVVIGNVSDGTPSGSLLATTSLTVSQKLIAINDDDSKVLLGLPTSDTGLPSGSMWNDGGTVKIKA